MSQLDERAHRVIPPARAWWRRKSTGSPRKVHVIADPGYPTAEICVLDGNFSIVGEATGSFEDDLAPGLYVFQFKTGRSVVDVQVTIRPGLREYTVPLPELKTKSAAPLANTPAGERFGEHASLHSRETHVNAGGGGQLYIFIRDSVTEESPREGDQPPRIETPAARRLFNVGIHQPNGTVVADLSEDGVGADDGTWRACNISLDPGAYLLRCDAGEIGSLEQTVIVSPGWHTQVFCSSRRYGSSSPVLGPDFSRAALAMTKVGRGFSPDDATFGWIESARVSLASANRGAPEKALTRDVQSAKALRATVVDQSLIADALAEKFTNPMLGLLGGHLLLLENKPNRELLREVVENLAILIPGHPDLQSLQLIVPEVRSSPISLDVPPMLRSSWRIIIDRTIDAPTLVPPDSYAARAGARIWGGGCWLTWKPPRPFQSRALSTRHVGSPGSAIQASSLPIAVTVRRMADDPPPPAVGVDRKWAALYQVIAHTLPRHDVGRFIAWQAQRLALDEIQTRVVSYVAQVALQAQFTEDFVALPPSGVARRVVETVYSLVERLWSGKRDETLQWLITTEQQSLSDSAAVKALGLPQSVLTEVMNSLGQILEGGSLMAIQKMCFDRLLPKDLNQVRPIAPKAGARPRAAFEWAKLWGLGETLRISLLGGTAEQQAIVKQFAPQWTQHANLKFSFENVPNAEIRISFVPTDGSWSNIGTDCRSIPAGQSTMNLGWQDEGVVLHEFGHAIGLIHEHQNPTGGIQWNKPAVYQDLGGPPNFWDAATVDHNLFETYDKDRINGTTLDPDSIMLYAIPASWTTNGWSSKPNNVLSKTDAEFAHDQRNYPFKGARQPHE